MEDITKTFWPLFLDTLYTSVNCSVKLWEHLVILKVFFRSFLNSSIFVLSAIFMFCIMCSYVLPFHVLNDGDNGFSTVREEMTQCTHRLRVQTFRLMM